MDGNIKPKNKCTKYKLEIRTWSKKKLTAPPPVFLLFLNKHISLSPHLNI